jgi:DnaA family protein
VTVNEERMRQLVLKFAGERRCTLGDFEAGPNQELVAEIGRRARGSEFGVLWLVGESGAGKSHLLQGACHAAVDANRAAAYLPSGVMAGGIEVLDGLGAFGLVALDDADRWIGAQLWEEALLHLYQQLSARGATLLLASSRGPLELEFRLADLASRLRGSLVFAIRPLEDADRAHAIERLAAQRGLELGADVMSFILRRAPRRMDALIAAFERLDRGALTQQRRLTIPLAKDVLGL